MKSSQSLITTYILSFILFFISIFILVGEFKSFNLSKNNFLLLLVFLIITVVFNYFNTFSKNRIDKDNNSDNFIINANFNYPFIFLTNPIFAFIYSVGYGVIYWIQFKDKEKAIFYSLQTFIVAYIPYVFIFKITISKELLLTPKFLILLTVSFLISISLERLMNIIYSFIEGEGFSFEDVKILFLSGYIPTFFIALFTTPIIVFVYNDFSFSGLLFPIGLIFVMFYSFKSNINKQMELEDFKERSYRDGLTGLYNRRYLEEYLDELSPKSENIAVIMMDIDKFKSVNDNYNHSVGDQVLVHFSTILERCVRQYDMVARYGGEEFTIILRQLSPEQSKIVAERIRASVHASYAPVDYNGSITPLRYTTSLGLFYCHEHRSYHLKDAIKEADKLLYASKIGGRNRVTSNI